MLSRNHIHHGDCLDLIREVDKGSVQLIVTDPPYFLGMTHNGQKGSFVDLAICKPFYKQLFAEYRRVLTPTGEVYFFTDWRGYAFYYPLFDAVLGCYNLIVWDKMNGPGTSYKFQHEFIMFHCANPKHIKVGPNVWRSRGFSAGAKATNGEKVHPTQKTLEVIEKIVGENTREGDLVLDTFGGSGTTGVVCEKLGRDFIVMELDEDNIEIARRRAREAYQATIFTRRDLEPGPNQDQ